MTKPCSNTICIVPSNQVSIRRLGRRHTGGDHIVAASAAHFDIGSHSDTPAIAEASMRHLSQVRNSLWADVTAGCRVQQTFLFKDIRQEASHPARIYWIELHFRSGTVSTAASIEDSDACAGANSLCAYAGHSVRFLSAIRTHRVSPLMTLVVDTYGPTVSGPLPQRDHRGNNLECRISRFLGADLLVVQAVQRWAWRRCHSARRSPYPRRSRSD